MRFSCKKSYLHGYQINVPACKWWRHQKGSSAELRIQFFLRTADSVHLVLTRCNCVYYCRARPIGRMTRQFIYLYFYIKNTWKLNDLRFLPSKIHILGNIVMIVGSNCRESNFRHKQKDLQSPIEYTRPQPFSSRISKY